MPILHDDHLHLRGHTKPPKPHALDGLLRAARERGIAPGIREHIPLPRDYRLGEFGDFEYAMRETEVERFVSLFKGTDAALGLEADYLPGYEKEIEGILQTILGAAEARGAAVSAVNGSVHLLPGAVDDPGVDKGNVRDIIWDLDKNIFNAHIAQRGAAGMLDDYFGRMRSLIATGMYDALSHIELIRKFDRIGDNGKSVYFGEVESLYQEYTRQIIGLAGEAGMAVELNTAGIRNPLGRTYLSQELLNQCAALDVPVCVGSDAHAPEGVGAHFDIARDMLRRAGITSLVTFRNRKMLRYDI